MWWWGGRVERSGGGGCGGETSIAKDGYCSVFHRNTKIFSAEGRENNLT